MHSYRHSAHHVASNSFSESMNTEHMASNSGVQLGSERLQELAAGIQQFVRIDRKAILEKIMNDLGSPSGSEFTEKECSAYSVKVLIKLDVSTLEEPNGNCVMYTDIEGEESINPNTARESAVYTALKYLSDKYKIEVRDFSSQAKKEIEKCDVSRLVVEAIASLDKVLAQWDMVVSKYKNFTDVIEEKKFCDHFYGHLSEKGQVYGVLSDYLISKMVSMEKKATELRSELDELKYDKAHFEDKMKRKAGLLRMEGPFKEVVLSSKDVLECVLSFYGLKNAKYCSTTDPFGFVGCEVTFKFPYMKNFRYGGKIKIESKSYSTPEAEDKAAYEALMFIEKNFKTKVIDYNYNQRLKAIKAQQKLILMLSTAVVLGDKLKMLFCKLNSAIQLRHELFNFDPRSFFSGRVSEAQVEAYYFCSNGLKDFDKYSAECYAAAQPYFEVLQRLTWKLNAAVADLPS